jgi:regulation of enolase protein 1 (concanavalin A-like superfamily)
MGYHLKGKSMRKHRSVLATAVARVEGLEMRRLLHAGHDHGGLVDAGQDTRHYDRELAAAHARNGADRGPGYYKAVRRVTSSAMTGTAVKGATGDATAGATGDAAPTFSVNAAGLPLLSSRADGVGMKIFLDFDGNGSNLPFGIDSDDTTFNAAEQGAIYQTWRDTVSYFAPFNVNVTTIQPATGGTNPLFAWHLTSKSISGGYAYVNSLTRTGPSGFNQANDAVSRTSGITHELGHIVGLSHQGEWDRVGVNVTEYTSGWGVRDAVLMGTDYTTNVRNWIYGRTSGSAATLQNDINVIAAKAASVVGGDGYRPDDFGGTTGTAYVVASNVQRIAGIIEKQSDVDMFRFSVASAGQWHLDATPTYESSFAGKIELLDVNGVVVASRDDTDQRNGRNNDVAINVNLAAGTYYLRLATSGDYSELGEYLLTISPLPAGFESSDIDAANSDRGGTASYDPTSGILTHMASGTDIAGSSDQFRFTHDQLNGDGSIVARVLSLDNTDASAKAGVMIRGSIAANSAFAMVNVTPSGTVQFIRRTSNGGTATTTSASPGALPRWVRLQRTGSNFTASYSADGVSWTALGTTTSITMNPSVQVGFASTARGARKSGFAEFSNFAFTGSLGEAAPVYNTLAAPTGLVAAAAAGASTAIVLNWNAVADAVGYFVERSVDGVEFTRLSNAVAAGVTSFTDSGLFGSMRWWYRVVARAGDATTSAPSATASAVNKPSAPAIPNSGYAVPAISVTTSTTTPIYLNWADVQGDQGYRVERSPDGVNFTTLSTTGTNLNAYNDTTAVVNTGYVYRITPVTSVGDGVAQSLLINTGTRWTTSALAITARASSSMSIGWTDFAGESGYRIERTTNGVTGWTSVATLGAGANSWTDSAVTGLNEYYYRLVALLPTGEITSSVVAYAASPPATALTGNWANTDIGTVGGTGAAGLSATGTYKVIGAGTQLGSTSDNFHFLYQPLVGDGSIVVRVASQKSNDIDDNAEAGIMIRDSLSANAAYAFVNVEPGRDGTTDFETRATTGGTASSTAGLDRRTPVWMRLTRAGNNFTGEASADGVTWTTIATKALTMPTTTPVYIGMAVSAIEANVMSNATFSSVTITGNTNTNTAPTVAVGASANPNPVTGTTATLSVLGADDKAESGLKYTWMTLDMPAGATAPTFASNGTNANKSTQVTFSAAGTYMFRVMIVDAEGLWVPSDVSVTVVQTATTLSVAPAAGSVAPGGTRAFSVSARDQFGTVMTTPAVTWSTSAGSIDTDGVLTAPAGAGTVTVTATSGTLTGAATVTVGLTASVPLLDLATLPHNVTIVFNGDVSASLAASDFVVTNRSTGVALPTSEFGIAFDAASGRATLSYIPGRLADGHYRLEVQSGAVSTASGAALEVPVQFDFGIYAGDVNGDLKVNFDDLLVQARNYGKSGNYSQGDLDYNGVVNFDDLLILARRYGRRCRRFVSAVPVSIKGWQRRQPDPAAAVVG